METKSVDLDDTVIQSNDFDRLSSEVASAIWNQLIEKPPFGNMQLSAYADIFEAVADTLKKYKPLKSSL